MTCDMTSKVMQRAISLAVSGGNPFHLQLTGGEPTLVPGLVEEAAALANDAGQCISIGIQTNGTCLTPVLAGIFKKYHIEVGVSLDGPPSIHEQQRGRASDTFRGLQLLERERIPFRVTTVVTQGNVAFLDRLVLSLSGFGCARGIGLDLMVAKGRAIKGSGGAFSADLPSLEKGLKSMVKTLDALNAERDIPIRLRERDLLITAGQNKRGTFCHACLAESMAVSPDGKIFPCGQTLGDEQFAAGTIRAPELENLKILQECKPDNTACSTCVLEKICPGDCPSRLYYNRNINGITACDIYRTLWKREIHHQ